LTVLPGSAEGEFNSNGTITFTEGALIEDATFEICDQ